MFMFLIHILMLLSSLGREASYCGSQRLMQRCDDVTLNAQFQTGYNHHTHTHAHSHSCTHTHAYSHSTHTYMHTCAHTCTYEHTHTLSLTHTHATLPHSPYAQIYTKSFSSCWQLNRYFCSYWQPHLLDQNDIPLMKCIR